MFSNTFKRRKDKNTEPASGNGEAPPSSVSSASPKPEEQSREPTPQETPEPADDQHQWATEAGSVEDVGHLVQDSREAYIPYEPPKDDEALKLNIDERSETAEIVAGNISPEDDRTEHSGETTIVDPNDTVSSSIPVDMDMFDTASRGVRKSDLWALVAELEGAQKEKVELHERTKRLGEQLATSDKKVEEMKAEVKRCGERIQQLEVSLKEEREKAAAVEEDGKRKHAALQEAIREQEARGKGLESQLAEEKELYERSKRELTDEMKRISEQADLSEQKAIEFALEVQLRFEKVDILEQTLKTERLLAREADEEAKRQVAAAYKRMEESERFRRLEIEKAQKLKKDLEESTRINDEGARKYDAVVNENALQAETIKSLEQKAIKLAEQMGQKDRERQGLFESVLRPLQAAFSDLRASVDKLRLNNDELAHRLEANANAEGERFQVQERTWKRRGIAFMLTTGTLILVLAIPRGQRFAGGTRVEGGVALFKAPVLCWV